MSAPTFKKPKGNEPQKVIALRIPEELWKRIEDSKWIQKKSVNQLIVEALERAFEVKSNG